MSKKYAYIYRLDDEGYYTGFDSVEAAIAAARERDPDAETVYVTETEEFVPHVFIDRVVGDLQECIDDACPGCSDGYLDDVPHKDLDELSNMISITFERWSRARGIKYWVDIPNGKDCLYDLRTGKAVEGRRENEGYSVSRQG